MIAVTGAAGVIGSELVRELRIRFGPDKVIALWNKTPLPSFIHNGLQVQVDATDFSRLKSVVLEHKVTVVYHLAAVLSADGEKDPMKCWDTNTRSLLNVLNLAKEMSLEKVFWASSIAAFGPSTPKSLAPQQCHMDPVSIYGISKVTGELLCQYFHQKFNVDVRALRYIGILTAESLPSGGTSDYALEMFHWACTHPHEPYPSYLRKDTKLPWMHMSDAINATIQLMSVPRENITIRTAYNISSVSFTVHELELCIKKKFVDFSVKYPAEGEIDVRQKNCRFCSRRIG